MSTVRRSLAVWRFQRVLSGGSAQPLSTAGSAGMTRIRRPEVRSRLPLRSTRTFALSLPLEFGAAYFLKITPAGAAFTQLRPVTWGRRFVSINNKPCCSQHVSLLLKKLKKVVSEGFGETVTTRWLRATFVCYLPELPGPFAIIRRRRTLIGPVVLAA